MNEQKDMKQLLARLDKLDTNLRHVKMLLLAIIALLLLGFFGASIIMETTVTFLLCALLLSGVIYASMWFLWGMTRLKFSPTPDQDLRDAVLGKTPGKSQ